MENNLCGPQYCPQNIEKMAKNDQKCLNLTSSPRTSARPTLEIKMTDSKTKHVSSMVLMKIIHMFHN